MTMLPKDILLVDGDELRLFSTPLDEYISSRGKDWALAFANTGNIRGYFATWAIENEQLFLIAVQGWFSTKPIHASHLLDVRLHENLAALPYREMGIFEPPTVPLDSPFPGAGGRVLAHWLSGKLRASRGKRLNPRRAGTIPIFQEILVFTIDHGHVVQREIVDGRVDRARREVAHLFQIVSGQCRVPAMVNRQALRSAIVRFADETSFEDLEPSSTATEYLKMTLRAAEVDVEVLRNAIREHLNAEKSGSE